MNCNVKITKRTKTAEIAPLLTKERIEQFLERVDEVALEKPIMEMPLREFKDALKDDYYVHFLDEKYAIDAFGKIKSYKRQMEDISKLIELYSIERTAEEKMASQGVNFPDTITSMIDDVKGYFQGIKSFEEAQERTIGDWLVIAKINKAKFQYQSNLKSIEEDKRNASI